MAEEILICAHTGHFVDDVPAHCASCHAPIVHRPHVPPGIVKMCATCVAARIAEDDEPPEVRVSEETRRELALYYATTKGTQ
jgi:hypothetical protein